MRRDAEVAQCEWESKQVDVTNTTTVNKLLASELTVAEKALHALLDQVSVEAVEKVEVEQRYHFIKEHLSSRECDYGKLSKLVDKNLALVDDTKRDALLSRQLELQTKYNN